MSWGLYVQQVAFETTGEQLLNRMVFRGSQSGISSALETRAAVTSCSPLSGAPLTESTCWLEISWRALLLLLVLWINYGISFLKYVAWPWLLGGERSTHSPHGHSLGEQNNKMRKKGNPCQPHLLAAPCMTCCPDCPVRNRSMLKYLIPLGVTFH